MMRISKRQFLFGSAAVGVGLYVAGRGMIQPTSDPSSRRDLLAVFDGRSDAGRAFGAQARGAGVAAIDLTGDPQVFWTRARTGFGLSGGARIIGITGWDETRHAMRQANSVPPRPATASRRCAGPSASASWSRSGRWSTRGSRPQQSSRTSWRTRIRRSASKAAK